MLANEMRKASAASRGDDVDARDDLRHSLAAQAAIHYLAAQAAIKGHKIKTEQRREWAAAAVAVIWLLGSVATVLVACAGYFWP